MDHNNDVMELNNNNNNNVFNNNIKDLNDNKLQKTVFNLNNELKEIDKKYNKYIKN